MTKREFLRTRRHKARYQPRFELLEDRCVPAALLTVNSPLDTNARDTVLTLREALFVNNRTLAVATLTAAEQLQVDGTPTDMDTDTIAFNIAGAGVQTISINSELPTITEAVEINGYTQPDARANTNGPGLGSNAVLRIQIVPSASLGVGLRIAGGGSTVRGLVINGFFNADIDLQTNGGNTVAGNFIGITPDGQSRSPLSSVRDAVRIQSSNNTIGGTAPADRNVLSPGGSAIHVPSNAVAEASNNVFQGNFLGTDAAGMNGFRANFEGAIRIESGSGNQIGGTGLGEGNLIAGRTGIAIDLGGPTPGVSSIRNSNGGHVIQGNLIGTDLTGAALLAYTNSSGLPALGIEGNQIFIIGLAHFDPTVNPLPIIIGGTDPGAGNVLAGSASNAISLRYPSGFTAATSIQGNFIGTDRTGVLNFGNQFGGINFDTSPFSTARNVTITGNTIAFNGERFNSAISIPSGETGILIVDNSIHDGGDGNPGIIRAPGGVGPEPPTLTSVAVVGPDTTVQGTVSGTAGSTIRVDLYANAPTLPPITVQGQTPVRNIQVLIGASGAGAFNTSFPTVPSQPLITATATSPTNTTSPFSAALSEEPEEELSADLRVTKTDSPDPVTVGQNVTYTVTVLNNGPDAATNVALMDTLPTGVTFVSATGGVMPVGGVLTFDLGMLANLLSASVTIVVRADTAGRITNTVSATADQDDSDSINNTGITATTDVEEADPEPLFADLQVTKSDSPDPVLVGENVTYTVTVFNNGPDAATNVVLTDTLPAGVTFLSATGGAVPSDGVLTFNFGTLTNGSSGSVMIIVRPNQEGIITNQASVSAEEQDPNENNNAAVQDTTVGAVNDAPSFTAGSNQIVQSGAGPQSVTGWATNISAGPPNEALQILQFLISTDLPSLFATTPTVSSDGTLTYTPAPGARGVAIVTVQLRDDGGTENDGRDTSPAETFTITMLANGGQCVAPARAAESVSMGNVRARMKNGTLSLIGDAASNTVSMVAGSMPGYIRVSGVGSTAVNGRAAAIELGPITRSINVQLGGGDDHLVLDGSMGAMAVPGKLIVSESAGDGVLFDRFDLRRGSSGHDTVAVIDALLEGGLSVRLRAGNDMVALCGSTVHGESRVRSGRGSDTVLVDDSTMYDLTRVTTGRGPDAVAIDTAGDPAGPRTLIHQCVRVKTRRGNDTITLGSDTGPGNSVQNLGCTKIRGGRGQDRLNAGLLSDPNANGNDLAQPPDVRGIEHQMS